MHTSLVFFWWKNESKEDDIFRVAVLMRRRKTIVRTRTSRVRRLLFIFGSSRPPYIPIQSSPLFILATKDSVKTGVLIMMID